MNESGVDYFCVGVALHCFLFCFVLVFLEGEYKKIPTRYFNLVSHKDNHNCSALVLQRYIPYSGAFKTIRSLIFIHYSQ